MENQIDRRNWMKSSAMLLGSIALLPTSLKAAVKTTGFNAAVLESETDSNIILNAPVEIKARLSANENPFGPSEKAKKAIMDTLDKSYQYPFMFLGELSEKIAAFEGIKENNILMAAGSSPLLLAAAMHFSKDGGSIVTADPSYLDLPSKAEMFGCKIVKVPLTSDYKIDLDAMEKAIDSTTKLVYICNPNNPTATVLDTDKLKAFCERISKNVTVFVDEAYIDYLPDPQAVTVIDNIKNGQNIIVARTFSKLYGFAGLRVGYVVAQPDMIKKLSIYAAGPMSISSTSVRAAIASYQDREFLDDALIKTNASKQFLYETLKKEGYEYIPSTANFVMFPIRIEGQKFASEMGKRGVSIRTWKFIGKDWCRVSIGKMDEMQIFADAFNQIA